MSTVETGSVPAAPAASQPANGPLHPTPAGEPPRKRRGLTFGRLILFLLFVGAAAGAAYTYTVGTERARQEAARLVSYAQQYIPDPGASGSRNEARPSPKPAAPWDGFVRVKTDDAKAIGLLLHTVEPQVEPINLPLMGRTDYDPNTLSKIRPRFDTLVEKVRVSSVRKSRKAIRSSISSAPTSPRPRTTFKPPTCSGSTT